MGAFDFCRKGAVACLVAAGILFFILGNNVVSLTNPDEVFYAQTAQEMAAQRTWLVPVLFGQPNFEKPVLTYVFLRIGDLLFGPSAFGYRFFPAVFALLGVLAVYRLVLAGTGDRRKAVLSGFVLMSSGLYIGLARTVFTDMIFSVFIALALVYFFEGYTDERRRVRGWVLFFVMSGLAVLTKGVLGWIVPFVVVLLFLGVRRDLKHLRAWPVWAGLLVSILIAAPWYIFMIKKFGSSFIQEFFVNDHLRRIFEAEHPHNDRWYFYLLSMAGGVFPWSLFLLGAFVAWLRGLKTGAPPLVAFILSWFFGTLLVFQFAHSKLVSYIFPVFPALAVMTGVYIGGEGSRVKNILAALTLAVVALFPVSVIMASSHFPEYVTPKVREWILVYAVVQAVVLVPLIRALRMGLWDRFVYVLALQVPLALTLMGFTHSEYDAFASSEKACAYLMERSPEPGTILCSKMFVRGVRYYTGRDVAVVNVGGSDFFSPHPVPYLDTRDKLRAFILSQPVTYGVVRRSSVSDIENSISGTGYSLERLTVAGDEHVVRVRKEGVL